MKKLIKGIHEFHSTYFTEHTDLFAQLAHGQSPRVLFITCSDSRIVPSLITHAEPGELFVIRNAGNLVPPYGAANGGEGASIEYAIAALNIDQIIICGHNHCGAMKGLLKLEKLRDDMPLVYNWLLHTEATRRLLKEHYSQYEGEELLEIAIAENVITQIENIKTYPVVRSRISQGKLHIYGWIYEIETGEVLAYNPETHNFEPPQTHLYVEDSAYNLVPGQFVRTTAPLVPESEVKAQQTPTVSNITPISSSQVSRIYRGSYRK
jgi:carbonic anhydrase